MDDVNDTEIKKHFLWICGPSGTGKSHTARRIAKEIGCEQPYLKDLNKWWNGYAHQKVTIIEEASPKACEYLASFSKNGVTNGALQPNAKEQSYQNADQNT